jgi:hypothetical protein
MERALLESIAFDMVMGGMDHNGEEADVWEEIRRTSDEDLINWIVEE